MIAVDTSALISLILDEPTATAVEQALGAVEEIAISGGTLAEAFIVALRNDRSEELSELLAFLNLDLVPVTREFAERVGEAYARWGKGIHPAGLNFGDCFAYVLAKERGLPLLFVGDDFAQTDVISALSS